MRDNQGGKVVEDNGSAWIVDGQDRVAERPDLIPQDYDAHLFVLESELAQGKKLCDRKVFTVTGTRQKFSRSCPVLAGAKDLGVGDVGPFVEKAVYEIKLFLPAETGGRAD